MLQVPGAPQGLQPTLCVLDGLLHVAESGRSLRSYLRARAGGAELPTGAGDAPTAVGEPLANLELWFDPAQLYESYHDLWLPLMMLGASPRLLDRDDLPDPDEFAEHTAPVRVVASRDDDRLLLRSQGTLGGPFLTAWLFSLLPGLASPASELVAIENAYGNHVAQRAAAAIAAFEAREGRRPRDLAELFVAAAWPDEALLLPMDDGAEELQLPGGRRVRTSFRYYADPVEVELFNRGRDAVLLQIRPGSGRIMVEAGGDVRAVYGPAAEQPIDAFGR